MNKVKDKITGTINLQKTLRSKRKLSKKDANTWVAQVDTLLQRNSSLSKKDLIERRSEAILQDSTSRIALLQGLLTQIRVAIQHRRKQIKSLIPIPAKSLQQYGARIIKQEQKEHLRSAIILGKQDNWAKSLNAVNKAIQLSGSMRKALGVVKPPINILHHWCYATFMLKGNTPELRNTIRQYAAQYPNDAALAYWDAHYNIMAGNYADAFRRIQLFPQNASQQIDAIIRSILDPSRTKNAYVPFPCNFYTYRYTLMDNDKVTQFSQLLNKAEFSDVKITGKRIINAYREWNNAIDAMNHQNYSGALRYLNECRKLVLEYLLHRHSSWIQINANIPYEPKGVKSKLRLVAHKIINASAPSKQVFYMFRRRYVEINLHELHHKDWKRPMLRFKVDGTVYDIYNDTSPDNDTLIKLFSSDNNPKIAEKIDAPLILLGMVFIPFATIEAYRQTRQYDRAFNEANELFRSHDTFKTLSDFIEVPFLKILVGQIMMEKADSQYKSGELVMKPSSFSTAHHNLKAASTYDGVIRLFLDLGYYVNNVQVVAEELRASFDSFDGLNVSSIPPRFNRRLNDNVLQMDAAQRTELSTLGKNILFPQFNPVLSNRLSVTPSNSFPARNIVAYTFNGNAIRETNPLIYSIVLEAKAKLLQIHAGLNYLGYRDDYVPPWKFFYLVDRARYYADQAKSLQRDYLNFISNAEREQFQEMNLSQTVTMERMNVAIDESRLEQSRAELVVAKESEELAQLQAVNAQTRLNNFENYDSFADSMDVIGGIGIVMSGGLGIMAGALTGAAVGAPSGPGAFLTATGGAILGAFLGGGSALTQGSELLKGAAERDMEKRNLRLNVGEATQAGAVAGAQTNVAKDALEVSSLQTQASIMRHEFAIQNYEFLSNRITNAELWFRLAHSIRYVASIYLRRAVELSFLAEQVYEFMVDKRVNVIRFDYDNDELGAMLGADYLKADLDYLESHLVFTQREKQQKLKCVISLARDFPQALQELGENESTIVPVTLEYLEKRFPGVYNMKVSAVELQPIAIMDPTRFNVEMTFMGSGTIRTKTYPVNTDGTGEQSGNNFGPYGTAANPWIPNADVQFPVKSLLCPVETFVFAGLTTAEDSANFLSFSTQQKRAFEDCPTAAGWLLDMSMTENKVVRGSLADVVVTFYLTGFYDSDLKVHVDRATETETRVVNKIMSARAHFSDQYFGFERTGNIELNITPNLLSINERIGELKQLGVYFMPAVTDLNYTRFFSQEITRFKINNSRNLSIIETAPSFRIKKQAGSNNKHLALTIQLDPPLDSASHDKVEICSDENPVFAPTTGRARKRKADILFNKQGRHVITVRVTQDNKLAEFTLEVYVSDAQPPILPDCLLPEVDYDDAAKQFVITASRLNNADNVTRATENVNATVVCLNKDGRQMFLRSAADSPNTVFTITGVDLPPDEYFLITLLSLPVKVDFSCNQRSTVNSYSCMGNKLATNKGFTITDNSTTPPTVTPVPKNVLTRHLLGSPVSPLDNWRFDLSGNSFLSCYDCNGNPTVDVTLFRDVILFLEFELKRRLS